MRISTSRRRCVLARPAHCILLLFFCVPMVFPLAPYNELGGGCEQVVVAVTCDESNHEILRSWNVTTMIRPRLDSVHRSYARSQQYRSAEWSIVEAVSGVGFQVCVRQFDEFEWCHHSLLSRGAWY